MWRSESHMQSRWTHGQNRIEKPHVCLTFLTKSLKVDIGKVKNHLRKQRDSGLVEKSKQKKENNRGGLQQIGGEIKAKEEEKNRGGFLLFKQQITSTITV